MTIATEEFRVQKGDIIRVSESAPNVESDAIWRITQVSGSEISLINSQEETYKVHASRIIGKFMGENFVENPRFTTIEDMTTETETKTKTKKTKKVVELVSPNFEELAKLGDIHSKDIDFADGIVSRAYCIMYKDHTHFKVFNTYNGTFGKGGSQGMEYPIKDEKAFKEKLKQLEKKNYILEYPTE